MKRTIKSLMILIILAIPGTSFSATPEQKAQLLADSWRIGNMNSDNLYDEALKKISALEEKYKKDTDPDVRNTINDLRLQKAFIFIERKKFKEAKNIINNVQKDFTNITSPTPYAVIRSYFLQGLIGKRTNKDLEAFNAFDDLVLAYAKFSTEPAAAWMVAVALAEAGYTYEINGNLKKARLYFEQAIKAFGASQQPEIVLALETASFRLTFLDFLEAPGEGSLASQNRYLARFDVPPHDDFEDHIAIVLYGKSLSLGLLKRSKELKTVLEEWIARFGNRTERPYTDHQADARATLAKLR